MKISRYPTILFLFFLPAISYAQLFTIDSIEVEDDYRAVAGAMSEGRYLEHILTTHPYLLKGIDIETAITQLVEQTPEPGRITLEVGLITIGPTVLGDSSAFLIFKAQTETIINLVPKGRRRDEISEEAFEAHKASFLLGIDPSEYVYNDSLAVLNLMDEQTIIASKYFNSSNIYFTEYTRSDDTNLYWIFGVDYLEIVKAAEPFKRSN